MAKWKSLQWRGKELGCFEGLQLRAGPGWPWQKSLTTISAVATGANLVDSSKNFRF